MNLETFDNAHGEVVLNALAVYAERMREVAAEAQAGSAMPEQAPEPPVQHEDGTTTIRITPTPNGFAHMAAMFTGAADQADAAHKAYEAMTGRDDDNDQEDPS
jgi:hypothetical protein